MKGLYRVYIGYVWVILDLYRVLTACVCAHMFLFVVFRYFGNSLSASLQILEKR